MKIGRSNKRCYVRITDPNDATKGAHMTVEDATVEQIKSAIRRKFGRFRGNKKGEKR